MKLIISNLKGHYKEVFLGPFFKLVEAILELMVPLVMADIIDVGIANSDTKYILSKGLELLGIAVAGIICAMICQYFAAVAGGYLGRRLRSQLYAHVMRLSDKETSKFGEGQLITLVTNDAYQIQVGLNMMIRLASRVPFLAIGSIVMALMLNFQIGIIFLIATPIVALALYIVMKVTLPEYGRIQSGQDDLSRLSRENLAGARVIRAFHRQYSEKEEFDSSSDALTTIMMRMGKLSALLNPVTGFIINIAILIIVWLGAQFTFQGISNPGQIIALVSYMNTTLLALTVAVNLIIIFTRALASLKRVNAVLDTEPSIVDGAGREPVEDAYAVELEEVHFAYHEEAANAIDNVSVKLPRGKVLGIIGGTGSGKTTLANLIMRFNDTDQGSVMVGGVNVKEYTLSQLRNGIGLVPQKASLFTGTLEYNLKIASPDAKEEDLWHALKIAQAEDFVRAMPKGLGTKIEEGGKNLSGGQRQRLTIARAIVKKPRLLILDDSASALDYATDAALRRAIARETDDMAVIIISQRAASIKNADVIIVLDEGKAVGEGKHDDLLKTCDVYREICISQGIAERQVG